MLGADVGVIPVEVRLLGGEQVQVPLAGHAIGAGRPRPGAPAEDRCPAVGGIVAVGSATGPEPEPFPLRAAGPRRQRCAEPCVLVRDVVGDDVDDRPNTQLPGPGDEGLGLLEGPERGIDGPIVGDVVAAVSEGRAIPGSEPDCVDAQLGEVGKAAADSR